MTKTWATFGADLHLEITGTRVRAEFEKALREAVRSGRLHPGTRLPSSRVLAGDLGIARNTVADAYAQLVAEGWLEARPGSGTWVAERVTRRGRARPVSRPAAQPTVRYTLAPGSPDLSSFPRSVWLAAARRALSTAAAADLGYGDPRGQPLLRTELADYLARARGVHSDPDQVVVCTGMLAGLGLLARVLRRRGAQTVAMEQDGHRLHRDVVTGAGLRVRAVPVDTEGAQVAAFGDAEAAVLTPAHQFPHGVPLAPHRRTAAVRWAADHGGLIVEDDYDGEFRYDRQAVGAMQALAPERVVYAGTASKTLAPGVRLAWLVVPPALIDDVLDVKRTVYGMSGALDQLTFAELLRSGAYDRHVRSRRLVYRRRRTYLLAAVARVAPQVRPHGVAAGLHTVLELPPGTDEAQVVRRAAAHGVAVSGLAEHRLSRRPSTVPGLVVSFGTPADHAFTAAVARLCAVLAEIAS
jgi:GntR family transcriptional regulator/MocR family aminotransferase